MQKLNYDTILQESRAIAHDLHNQRSFWGYNRFDTEGVAAVILLLLPIGNFAPRRRVCIHRVKRRRCIKAAFHNRNGCVKI